MTADAIARSPLVVLMDWDNLPDSVRHRGAVYSIDAVLAHIPAQVLASTVRISARLYGGWYENSKYTRPAQHLDAELQRHYPATYSIGRPTGNAGELPPRVAIDVTLATSLLSSPRFSFHRTLRHSAVPANMRAKDPRSAGCCTSPCALSEVVDFVNKRQCPDQGCTIQPGTILMRSEQKMVDTLLASDLVYAATRMQCTVAIVTSDDDLVPPLRLALDVGRSIIVHVLTKHDTWVRQAAMREYRSHYIYTSPMESP